MKLITDKEAIEITSVDQVFTGLAALHPVENPFVILEFGHKNYIQFAGRPDRLTMEARIYSEDSFKHFVIGKKPALKVWTQIDCKVGPIMRLKHEVLTLEDVKTLLPEFIQHWKLPEPFQYRNISKTFRE